MNSDTFHEPHLKFKIEKPSDWNFMPPAWSPVTQIKNALESDEEHWAKHANQPFCVATKHHESLRSVYATFQVSARYMPKPNNELATQLLASQITFLEKNFQDFLIIEATTMSIVSGCRSNKIYASYTYPFELNREIINASVVTLAYTIFTKKIAFSIGVSVPGEKEFSYEKDMQAIIESIRIDS